jgi:predicted transcriptional regulator
MATYRSQVRIVADILSTAKEYGEGSQGVRITTLLRRANMPYTRLTRILQDLVKSGLMVEVEAERGTRYRISERGIKFLREYEKFREFAETFGLRL